MLGDFHPHILDHVRSVNTALEAMVQAKGNHPAQPILVPHQQPSQAFFIVADRSFQQMISFARFFGHYNHHTNVIAPDVDLVTEKTEGFYPAGITFRAR